MTSQDIDNLDEVLDYFAAYCDGTGKGHYVKSLNKDETRAALLKWRDEAVVAARIEENQTYLDKINNYKPDPNAPSFGSASGAVAQSGWKQAFEDRIKTLEAE